MKKNIFMISAAMLALVSCTKDEVIQINKGQKIEFRTAVTTRATELTNANLPSFHVTALYDEVEYFSDVFTKTDGCFKSETDYYWPATEEVKFYAYYPYGNDLPGTVSINANEKKVTGFTPNTDIANQVDFVTAFEVYTKDQAANGSVELGFEHQLSQIEIKAKNTNSGYTTIIKAIRIKNVAGSGDFEFSAPVKNWTPSEVLANYEICCPQEEITVEEEVDGEIKEVKKVVDVPLTLTAEAQSLMWDKGNAMLIPQERPKWGVEEETTTEPEPTPEPGTESNDQQNPTLTAEVDDPQGNGTTSEDGAGNDVDGGDEPPTTPETEPEETDPNGFYVAFLVQVNTATGIRVFPTTEGVDYAWVAQPLAINWLAGYKYTYEFDFKDGAGVIAPDNFEDPNDPILPGGDEDPQPGDNVYGGKISVNVSFGGWSYGNGNTVDMKPQVPETEEEEEDIPAGGDTPAGGSTEE